MFVTHKVDSICEKKRRNVCIMIFFFVIFQHPSHRPIPPNAPIADVLPSFLSQSISQSSHICSSDAIFLFNVTSKCLKIVVLIKPVNLNSQKPQYTCTCFCMYKYFAQVFRRRKCIFYKSFALKMIKSVLHFAYYFRKLFPKH